MNIARIIIAAFWAYLYNSYFDFHSSSYSGEEIICDGIFAILMALSILNVKHN